ncbi:hypothetical protein EDI_219240 [Entamoeba dispar SAW760]|uniref:Uncharacterized protein n=1 Tax=Entamoeba dispar (strain ATCC PRA-260 / SAW760) TaxID=370354 RepID=B0EQ82_ENTDS|nr:uncharacterized protein EDI_219240 [Entamoeba dispar SAW760]EDR23305.1 hypothetical protein EDI_219240 [Entamoeba dispar SAW760]|eukprot:EDR23305.1 hypothetical protein EDI_219240 [Entamoeba dispar SAW760]
MGAFISSYNNSNQQQELEKIVYPEIVGVKQIDHYSKKLIFILKIQFEEELEEGQCQSFKQKLEETVKRIGVESQETHLHQTISKYDYINFLEFQEYTNYLLTRNISEINEYSEEVINNQMNLIENEIFITQYKKTHELKLLNNYNEWMNQYKQEILYSVAWKSFLKGSYKKEATYQEFLRHCIYSILKEKKVEDNNTKGLSQRKLPSPYSLGNSQMSKGTIVKQINLLKHNRELQSSVEELVKYDTENKHEKEYEELMKKILFVLFLII